MNDKKKKDKDKKQQILDIDFVDTTYGPIVIHRYKDKRTKNRPY